MHPTILEIGFIKLHSYGLMIAIGFLAAIFMVQRDVKKMGLDPKFVSEMGFVALVLGIAGTRVLYILMYPQEFSWSRPWEWFAIWQGGLVFQGAIPITFLYAYLGMKRRGIPFWKVVDSGIPSLALAQGFGRIGCFLNGCCYGQVAETLPWAVRFPPGRPVFQSQMGMPPMTDGWSHAVHPTQLYSALLLFSICIVLIVLRNKWHPFAGFTMPIYLILYGIKRFTVELFRGDLNPTALGLGYFSNQQVFAVIMLLLGIWLFFFLRSLEHRNAQAQNPPRTKKK